MTQPPSDHYVYSQPQLRALQSVITTSGLLSVIGSSLILMHAVHKRSSSIQHRILLGLSAFDMISSLGYIFFPFSFHAVDRVPGVDCTVETSLKLLGVGAILYNLALSVYYVLCIACLLPEQLIAKYWEPCLHMVCICFPLAWVIAGLALGIANPTAYHIGCHSNPYPRGCDEVGSEEIECERGGDGLAAIVFTGSTVVPIMFTWAGLFINSTVIVLAVYRQEQKKTRYDPSASSNASGMLLGKMIGCCRATTIPQTEWTLSYKMARQALQWVGCFSLTYTMALVMYLITFIDREGIQKGNYFPILFLMELCWPLQGFFDAFVYFRPKYTLWRTNSSLSCLEAIRRTLLSLEPAPTRPPRKPPLAIIQGEANDDTEESHVQDSTHQKDCEPNN